MMMIVKEILLLRRYTDKGVAVVNSFFNLVIMQNINLNFYLLYTHHTTLL